MLYAPNGSNASERRNTALKVAIVKAYQQEKSWQRRVKTRILASLISWERTVLGGRKSLGKKVKWVPVYRAFNLILEY